MIKYLLNLDLLFLMLRLNLVYVKFLFVSDRMFNYLYFYFKFFVCFMSNIWYKIK